MTGDLVHCTNSAYKYRGMIIYRPRAYSKYILRINLGQMHKLYNGLDIKRLMFMSFP